MAKSLREVLKRRVIKELSRRADTSALVGELWEAVVPERFRGHTRTLGYRRRTLDIAVDSPAILAELEGFHRHELQQKLREAFSDKKLPPPVRIKYSIEERT